jgi:hypothetical protein
MTLISSTSFDNSHFRYQLSTLVKDIKKRKKMRRVAPFANIKLEKENMYDDLLI